jgi:hypothetical protein
LNISLRLRTFAFSQPITMHPTIRFALLLACAGIINQPLHAQTVLIKDSQAKPMGSWNDPGINETYSSE